MHHKPTLITITFLFLAVALNAQTRPVSITAKNAPIKIVLAEIQQKSGYRILYNDEVVADDLRVSVIAENVAVKEILNTILKNTDLTFIMNNDELIIITKRQYISQSNEIFGTVTDENGAPVPYANVVLLHPEDTTRLGYGAVTDEQGYYKLANVKPASYRLRVSFIGYKTQYAEFVVAEDNQNPIVQNFTLPTDQTVLQELVVQGQRPALKAENGKLIYHVPTLLKSKSVTNAYDALKEIPGVMEQDERLTLIGTSGMTVLLNGKKTSMTYAQLMTMLKTIPLSRVEDVEIMYSAPPQYNIRGAAINVMLRQQGDDDQNVWQGEVAGTFTQKTYPMGNGRGSLLFLNKKTTADILYSYGYTKSENNDLQTSHHTLKDKVYYIREDNRSLGESKTHNLRLALGHTFMNDNRLDVAYNGNIDQSQSNRTTKMEIADGIINSAGKHSGPSQMHNVKIDAGFSFGLNMGGDYTYYKDKSDYFLRNNLSETNLFDTHSLSSVSQQKINRTLLYANQTHKLSNQWQINYGVNYSFTNTDNESKAKRNDIDNPESSFNTRQHEIIRNVFAGVSKTFSGKLSAQAALSVEFYKATEESSGKKTTIWDDQAFFPSFNLSYTPAPDHMLQFSLASDKTYP